MNWINGQLVSPGKESMFGERIVQGFRAWEPDRSKLSALFHKGTGLDLEPGFSVLYLGAAHGATVSFVADYVEVVYAVEMAARPFPDLMALAEKRDNIIPIMADGRKPVLYRPLVEPVDLIYQDIAQKDQADILIANTIFLKHGGKFILVLKSRSIEVSRAPAEVVTEAEDRIRENGLTIAQTVFLDPYYPDHAALIGHLDR